jgi:hypothetical protein
MPFHYSKAPLVYGSLYTTYPLYNIPSITYLRWWAAGCRNQATVAPHHGYCIHTCYLRSPSLALLQRRKKLFTLGTMEPGASYRKISYSEDTFHSSRYYCACTTVWRFILARFLTWRFGDSFPDCQVQCPSTH